MIQNDRSRSLVKDEWDNTRDYSRVSLWHDHRCDKWSTWHWLCIWVILGMSLLVHIEFKKAQRKCATAADTMKGQVARLILCFTNVFALKIWTQLQLDWERGGSSMQLILKCSLIWFISKQTFLETCEITEIHPMALGNRPSLCKLLSSSQRVHTVKQGNMWRTAETKSHLWEYHKWSWEFHYLLVSFQSCD